MWLLSALDMNLVIFVVIILPQVMIQALRDVTVTVPYAIRRGEKAMLFCHYDMEGDSLYSVKWYKGRREFYRYTPKENPAMKIFPMIGVQVVRHMSNESQLTLAPVQPGATGKYSCEVSADAPSFHTLIDSGDLEVVEVPDHKPVISGIRSRYHIGDSLRANCTSRHSKPAANLTWAVNELSPHPSHVRLHRTLKDPRNELETSISSIQFVITPQHFYRGKLKIRCIAHIHDVYWQITDKSIEEDRPKVLTAASSNSVNLIHGPHDQYSLQDGDILDKKDSYMTHMQGDMSSLNAGSAFMSSSLVLVLCMLQLPQLLVLYLANNCSIFKNWSTSSRSPSVKCKRDKSNDNSNVHRISTTNTESITSYCPTGSSYKDSVYRTTESNTHCVLALMRNRS